MEPAIRPTGAPRKATADRADKTWVNKAWLRALALTAEIERAPERILARVVEEQALDRPDAPALLSDEEQLSYGELAALARRYARWGLAQGLGKGETVALIAHGHPGYVAAWLGLTSVGVVVALVNTNLRGEALAHCLTAAAPRLLITTDEFAAATCEAAAGLPGAPEVWRLGPGEGRRIDEALAALPCHPLAPGERPSVSVRDPALLIYTSGTTGLPKAAFVSHHRVMSWSCWFAAMLDVQPADRLYDCLPMHHSVGGVVAPGALLVRGGSVVIARRFSVGRFWDEVVRWDCSLFQYIGELCRYLVRAAPSASERRHRLRIACGNGLDAAVWRAFHARFAVPRIVEFYAATEGNFSLFNLEGEPGAIGRLPGFMTHRFPVAIVAFDPETGAPKRDADGRCIRCPRGETGEAIGRISGSDGAHRFEGYTSQAETEKKVLRGVFEPGDAWLRTGDLMRIDERGFFRFVDRVGGSFRWKGENVSAAEVAAVVEACPGVEAAAVYGVSVPSAEGRAGMAAVIARPEFEIAQLRVRLAQALPRYARPLFVRLVRALPVTETFKTASHRLAEEGFDPARISDPLYIDDDDADAYAPLDPPRFERLARGELRL
jgi:fatty-acyl-CoA synthase